MPALDQGGVERGTIEIARAITNAGGRALVASRGGRLEPALRRAGAEHIALDLSPKNPFAIRSNAQRIAEIVATEGVDILHARSRAPAWAGYLAAKRTGTRFITTYHGTYSEGFPGKRFYNGVMAKGDPTIAPTHFIANLIRMRHKVPSNRIVVIPRGADIESFDESLVGPERTIALARAWGVIEDSRPIVLLPGRLTGWKGHQDMIAAIAAMKARRGETAPEMICIFAGEDGGSGHARKLEAAIEAAGLQGDFRLVGHTADMEAAYKLASVVVSPSTAPEAFGRVAVEAQAMGRPVIASAHGGSLETVEDGQTGWLFPPRDVEALSRALEEALGMDDSQRAHMGLAGRARVRSLFTVQAMQAATLEVYEKAAGRPFRPTQNR